MQWLVNIEKHWKNGGVRYEDVGRMLKMLQHLREELNTISCIAEDQRSGYMQDTARRVIRELESGEWK